MKRKLVIIDTDPGHDDALALMLALRSKKLRVLAVTTVAGNSTIQNTTRNARFVLKLLDAQNIPIYSGASKPLCRKLVKAVVHGKNGLSGLKFKQKSNLTNNAAEKIISIVQQNAGVTIITLGPLTNLAQAILKKPSVMLKVKKFVIMGGAIKVPGNKSRVAEFNFFVDPEAADIVFKFPVAKMLIPLDAGNPIFLKNSDFRKIRGSLKKPILQLMNSYMGNLYNYIKVKRALIYDALAVYSLIKPSACRKKRYNIVIETKGEATRGMSVTELRQFKKTLPNATVVEKISANAFKQAFINSLSKRG